MTINPDRNRRVLMRTASGDALCAFSSGLAAALLRSRHR
jgi:hypothetical protein